MSKEYEIIAKVKLVKYKIINGLKHITIQYFPTDEKHPDEFFIEREYLEDVIGALDKCLH